VPTVSDGSSIPEQRSIPRFTFDPEWLAITRAFHPYLSTRRRQADYPDEETARANVAEEMEWVKANVGDRLILDCQTFVQTAPIPGSEGSQGNHQRKRTSFSKMSPLTLVMKRLGIPILRRLLSAICLALKTKSISPLTIKPEWLRIRGVFLPLYLACTYIPSSNQVR